MSAEGREKAAPIYTSTDKSLCEPQDRSLRVPRQQRDQSPGEREPEHPRERTPGGIGASIGEAHHSALER